MEELPSEMKMNILARLPFKTIACSKSVSKPWYNLLSDPSFLSFHLKNQVKNHNLDIIFVHKEEQSIYYLELNDIIDTEGSENSTVVSPLKVFESRFVYEALPENELCTYPVTLGVYNGFICISIIQSRRESHFLPRNPIWVVNPITEQHFEIPDYSVPKPDITEGEFSAFTSVVSFLSGFGFEDSTNEFKLVIIIFYFRDFGYTLYENELQVHTVGTDNWRRKVGAVPEALYGSSPQQAIFVDGCLHWLTTDAKLSDNKPIILSFNLSGEEFGYVLTPEWTSFKDCHLGVFEKSLCIMVSSINYVEIWIMETYNVQESWVKRLSIRKSLGSTFWNPCTHVDIIKFCENGEIVLLLNEKYIIGYDITTERSRHFAVKGIDVESRQFFQGFPFVGSLLSLN